MKKLFTLIELIVVIVVLGILASIVVPNISNFKEEATISALEADSRNIETAIDMYTHKNNGAYPTEDGTEVISDITTSIAFDREQNKDVLAEEVDVAKLVKEGFLRKAPKHKQAKFYLVEGGDVIWNLDGLEVKLPDAKEPNTQGPSKETPSTQNPSEETPNTQNPSEETPNTQGPSEESSTIEDENDKYYSHVDEKVIPQPETSFEVSKNDTFATITNYTGTDKNVVIPHEIDGLPVEVIEVQAFSNKGLTSVVIPNSVKTIKANGFSKNSLTSVVIPDSVTTMGSYAFGENSLKSVVISKSLTEIMTGAFTKNSLTSVELSDSITSIGQSAFSENNLTRITIPKNVTRIHTFAFYKNYLREIVIPASVTNMGDNPFLTVEANQKFFVDTNNAYFAHGENNLGLYSKDYSKVITGSKDVLNTSEYKSVQIIGKYAFAGTKVDTVTIPSTVTSIEASAFSLTGSHRSTINKVVISNAKVEIGREAFFTVGLKSVDLGNAVTSIGVNAFASNNLTTVTIPATVKNIGEKAFFSNSNLSTIVDKSRIITTTNISTYSNRTPLPTLSR